MPRPRCLHDTIRRRLVDGSQAPAPAIMAWGPSSWLLLTRVFQLLEAVAGTGLNGFLTAWIYTRDLGVSKTMVVLQLLVCLRDHLLTPL